jgi:hypothetical protein
MVTNHIKPYEKVREQQGTWRYLLQSRAIVVES